MLHQNIDHDPINLLDHGLDAGRKRETEFGYCDGASGSEFADRLLRRLPGALWRFAVGRRRPGGRRHRRQRRRQKHAPEIRCRHDPRRARHDPLQRRAHRRHPVAENRRPRRHHGAGGAPAFFIADGRGKPAHRRPARPPGSMDVAACARAFSDAGGAAQPGEHLAVRRTAANGRHRPRADVQSAALLCDEISLGLAPIVVRDIFQRLPTIVAEGTAVVVVEQDVVQALAASTYLLLPARGAGFVGRRFSSLSREAIKAAYFGV